MPITESEPKLCTACWWSGRCADSVSSHNPICRLCDWKWVIYITRVIDYQIDQIKDFAKTLFPNIKD
jgi:hypothetical protein